jgi:hypothetical protein
MPSRGEDGGRNATHLLKVMRNAVRCIAAAAVRLADVIGAILPAKHLVVHCEDPMRLARPPCSWLAFAPAFIPRFFRTASFFSWAYLG